MSSKGSKLFSMSAPMQIFCAMVIGSALGLFFPAQMKNLKFVGDIWLNCIKLIVIPMVLCVLTLAIGSQKSAVSIGRVARRILIFYLGTTIIASIVGVTVASLVKPGIGMNLAGLTGKEIKSAGGFTFATFFSSMFSTNMYGSFAKGNVLQTIVIAIMFGISILRMKNEEHKAVLIGWIQSVNSMIFSFVEIVIRFAPVGVLFLMGDTFATYGFTIFTSIAGLIATFWLSIAVHVCVAYLLPLLLIAHINPFRFLRDAVPVWSFTMASCSSTATIPVNIETAEERFGVPSYIADFCLPLGSQMNHDGSALMYGCVLIFIGQMYGIPFDIGMLVRMVLVGTLLTLGGGGIPGSGTVKLLILVETFGLPVEVVGIVAGFYRFFDMGTTTGNCLGDLVGTVIVSRLEDRIQAKEAKSA